MKVLPPSACSIVCRKHGTRKGLTQVGRSSAGSGIDIAARVWCLPCAVSQRRERQPRTRHSNNEAHMIIFRATVLEHHEQH